MTPSVALRLLGLAGKQLSRHRVRTFLTLAGVGAGMFLFAVVESLQQALARATRLGANDLTLVVYRQNRFCPATSRLPIYYLDELRRIDGVREVIPILIAVNNCGASLDIVTFRGVPPDLLPRFAPDIALVSGSYEAWESTDDGALVGEHFAARRGLKAGDAFDAAGVRVRVVGLIRSPNPQDNQVAYVHLPFLQKATRRGLGEVTQFNVRVIDSGRLDAVARAIDDRFRSEPEPTQTHPEKAFFAEGARELVAMIDFTRWIGLGAALAVFGLVANAVLLIVRGRVRENAVLQTLGYPGRAVGFLVVGEGSLLGLGGGALGVGAALAFLGWNRFLFGSEGQTMAVLPETAVLVRGMGLALVLGAMAAAWPAWQAMRRPIVESLRT
ncbi:MAG: ABC transporter permease [Lentisphaerae bacterium]|nr:ABC transporter permease [Lentisphaerota bacterium]